jgi:hypothetical protein
LNKLEIEGVHEVPIRAVKHRVIIDIIAKFFSVLLLNEIRHMPQKMMKAVVNPKIPDLEPVYKRVTKNKENIASKPSLIFIFSFDVFMINVHISGIRATSHAASQFGCPRVENILDCTSCTQT